MSALAIDASGGDGASGGAMLPRASRQRALEALYATGHWLLGEERIPEAARVFRVLVQATPRDGRAWLGLGSCHEGIDQPRIALELYAAGSVVADEPGRCQLARARLLMTMLEEEDAEAALDGAEQSAHRADDQDLLGLVRAERGGHA